MYFNNIYSDFFRPFDVSAAQPTDTIPFSINTEEYCSNGMQNEAHKTLLLYYLFGIWYS